MKVKAKELRKMGKKELENKLLELRKGLMKSNAQVASGTVLENPGSLKQMKKTVARILTVKAEKQEDNSKKINE